MPTNQTGLRFHHFGLAVQAPESAFTYLAVLGYSIGAAIFDPLQQVNVALCSHSEMPDVEVIWPGSGPSPIDRLVKGKGSLLYHLCYVCDNAAAGIAALQAKGLSILQVAAPKPAVLFGGQLVSFYYVNNVGLVELIHGEPTPAS